ncbi:LacI family DNA-binding transcriptional regulator [Streptomyces rubiginosohelvolus]|uniref:LacI family DNA-binding transcriptional regulator n=1 Tax=Streptomyces rubiginosohelvolus TaxID=67362 RepID=UPI00364F4962
MGYAEKRGTGAGTYYRGRYKIAPGNYGTVQDDSGRTIRYKTKREATQAADAAEVAVRAGTHIDRTTVPTFAAYVQRWWARQALAPSTMQNYPNTIEGHLLPYFGDMLITDITREHVEIWYNAQRAVPYALASVNGYRSILHLILEDAVEDIDAMVKNPAKRRRNRGRRAGRAQNRSPEKVVTTALGALLVAERAALLSGRDDEFVQEVTVSYTGIRWGETVGLDREYVTPAGIQIQQQLYELKDGTFYQGPPKNDSFRTIDTPGFLYRLIGDHVRQQPPVPCPCHGLRTVFRAAALRPELRVRREDIAAFAGVSPSTVSRARLNPELISQRTRDRVFAAMEELGVVGVPSADQYVPHWDRNDHRHQIIEPASSGWFPSKGVGHEAHPVCVVAGDTWPGTVVKGRHSAQQATACWAPVAKGLTQHGLRHLHGAMLEDIGTPPVLANERMGHVDGSTPGRYKHVLPEMRVRLVADLSRLWVGSLAARAAMSPRSSVPILDRLLQEHAAEQLSRNSPQRVISQTIRRMESLSDLHVSKWVA